MASKQFNLRALAGFLKKQSAIGTFLQPVATDAVFMKVTPDLEPTFETVDVDFVSGDTFVPESFSYTSDRMGNLKYSTPIFRLSEGLAPTTPITVAQAPHSAVLQSCGGSVVILAADTWDLPEGAVIVNNVNASDVVLSADFRKTSAQDSTNQKSVQYKDLRSLVDLSLKPKEIPEFTFTLMGEVLNEGVPQARSIIHFTPPKAAFLPPIVPTTIVTSKIYPSVKAKSITFVGTTATVFAEAHGFSDGDAIKVSGINFVDADADGNINEDANQDVILYAGPQTIASIVDEDHFTYTMTGTPSANAVGNIVIYNIEQEKALCFNSLTANNLFGYELQRVISACVSGYVRGKVTTEVSCIIVEDQVSGDNFDPDANRGNFYALELKFGNGNGKYLTIIWDFLQIKDVKKSDIAILTGREITFRNDRHVYLIWS